MTYRGGEAPQVKGRIFDDKAHRFLEALGYKTALRHEHGFDMVGDPPQGSSGFLRPLFAPKYRTAFEFKSGPEVAIRSESRKLQGKIRTAMHSRITKLSAIRDGVLMVEGVVPQRTKRRIFGEASIHVWDHPVLLFLASKILFRNQLLQPRRRICEEKIGPWSTVLKVAKAYKNTIRFKVGLYYQHLFEVLNSDAFETMVSSLTHKLEAYADGLDLPSYVELETFSLSGISEDCASNYRKIIAKHSAGRVIYEIENVRIHRFDTAPWAFFL